MLFLAVYQIHTLIDESPRSPDPAIERRFPRWRILSEPFPRVNGYARSARGLSHVRGPYGRDHEPGTGSGADYAQEPGKGTVKAKLRTQANVPA